MCPQAPKRTAFQVIFQAPRFSKTPLSKNPSKMSDVTMAEISKGVWVPRATAARVMNPEDEDDHCGCMLPGYKCGDCRDEERGLKPVAAGTHAGATMPPALAPAPAGEDGYYSGEASAVWPPAKDACYNWKHSVAEKPAHGAFKSALTKDAYEAEGAAWVEAPESEQPDVSRHGGWYNCVAAWRIVKVPQMMWVKPSYIVEARLNGGSSLRYIIKQERVKGLLTRATPGATMEEVIIDTSGAGRDQVKLKFWGSKNALAFHVHLADLLD
jgi:hypothetical protein